MSFISFLFSAWYLYTYLRYTGIGSIGNNGIRKYGKKLRLREEAESAPDLHLSNLLSGNSFTVSISITFYVAPPFIYVSHVPKYHPF